MTTTTIRPAAGDDPGCVRHEVGGYAWLEGDPCPPHEELPGRPDGHAGRGWECRNCPESSACESSAAYLWDEPVAAAGAQLTLFGASTGAVR